MFEDFKVNMPYPAVCGEISERELLELYDLYAGRSSEMTATSTYVYQHVLSKKKYERVAELFIGIAAAEMRHIELLASAISEFGGDPVYAGKYNWFSGGYPDYEKGIEQMLKNDIIAENEAARAYYKAAENTENESLKGLLSRIGMDEEYHAAMLGETLKELFEERKNCE